MSGRDATTPVACFKCGYDLRGALGEGQTVCPECGLDYAHLHVPDPKDIGALNAIERWAGRLSATGAAILAVTPAVVALVAIIVAQRVAERTQGVWPTLLILAAPTLFCAFVLLALAARGQTARRRADTHAFWAVHLCAYAMTAAVVLACVALITWRLV